MVIQFVLTIDNMDSSKNKTLRFWLGLTQTRLFSKIAKVGKFEVLE